MEPLQIHSNNSFTSRLWRGLAQFHGLQLSEKVLESDDSCYSEISITIEDMSHVNEDESHTSIPSDDQPTSLEVDSDLLEITCTDVLLAMQEYSSTGLNARLLAGFVVIQIHGLDTAP